MINDLNKSIPFDVQLNWLTDTKGILTSENTSGSIHVAAPPEFGGEGRPWSPEHLFLGAVASCFMTTYISFSKKFKFEVSSFDCNVTGKVQIVEGKYKFTQIDVYSKIYVADEAARQKATLAIEKTQKYCLISNSINSDVNYHSEVLIDVHGEKEVVAGT